MLKLTNNQPNLALKAPVKFLHLIVQKEIQSLPRTKLMFQASLSNLLTTKKSTKKSVLKKMAVLAHALNEARTMKNNKLLLICLRLTIKEDIPSILKLKERRRKAIIYAVLTISLSRMIRTMGP